MVAVIFLLVRNGCKKPFAQRAAPRGCENLYLIDVFRGRLCVCVRVYHARGAICREVCVGEGSRPFSAEQIFVGS